MNRSTRRVARRHAVLAMTVSWLASRMQQSAARRMAHNASLIDLTFCGGPSWGSDFGGTSTEVSSTGRRIGACRRKTNTINSLSENLTA